jgi:hypothetical protein
LFGAVATAAFILTSRNRRKRQKYSADPAAVP